MPEPSARSPEAIALAAMGRTPLFQALAPDQRLSLGRSSRTVVLRAREKLWSEGGAAKHLGLVIAGRLMMVRDSGRTEVILDVAGPGDVLGELAFGAGASYQSTVVCMRRARVLLVPAAALRAMLESDVKATAALALDLANQLFRTIRRVESLSAGNVERRLARVLLSLAERIGEPFPGGTLIPMRLRRADLAALAATTLETTSRKISAWTRTGWIVPQPAGYLLRDVAAFQALAEED